MLSAPESRTIDENRYDRQLRLWGDRGQKSIARAHVCVLNATTLATEILKSLILAGIERFTIVDANRVDETDVGNNFFIDGDSIGRPRAQIAYQLLQELNPDVQGHYRLQSVEQMLEKDADVIDTFSVVVGTNLSEKTALQLSELLWQRRIPFIHSRCYGLIGYVRICVVEHTVIDSHPDNPAFDLRLDKPFASLRAMIDATDLEAMSHREHGHTPYLILLFKALEQWRKRRVNSTITTLPSNYEERREFRQVLLAMRKPDEKGSLDEENFQEACDSLTRCLHPTTIPENVRKLINDYACLHLSPKSDHFWILCSALNAFIIENGALPLAGSLPDMFSDSEPYVRLLAIFHEQARVDADRLYELVSVRLNELQLPSDAISREETANFCKNAANLHLLRTSSLRSELTCGRIESIVEILQQGFDVGTEPIPAVIWYILLRATDRFYTEKSRYPGTNGVPCDLDMHDLKSRVRSLLVDWHTDKLIDAIPDAAIDEICRYGASEPHSIAALTGGIVAHETVKLITRHYIPVDNTFIVDGHTLSAQSFQL